MTTKKHLKRRVRSRAAQTGESYATALRSIRRQEQDRVSRNAALAGDGIASCSFCGKPDSMVQRLVAGPAAGNERDLAGRQGLAPHELLFIAKDDEVGVRRREALEALLQDRLRRVEKLLHAHPPLFD